MGIQLDDSLLLSVEKPARYCGGEWNVVEKDVNEISIRFAFCFPDVYDVGMSHLGLKIIYHILNKREDTYCERVFAPWVDMEKKMRENNIPLFSLETKDPIKCFDFLGFTLQYEMSYTNILNMLDLAGIPIFAKDRDDSYPIICAGGPCACNPEPLADFFDFFVLGEGEEVMNEIMDLYKECKDRGDNKITFLNKVALIGGVYVPSLYNVEYNEDNTIKEVTPKSSEIPSKIRKRVILDMDKVDYPEEYIVPYLDIVHDRIMLEVFRGCTRGCRFCQAGFIYRPVREKSAQRLLNLADNIMESTGYEEISLVSLSTSDYSDLESFTNELIEKTEKEKVNVSLPSLRIDSFSLDLMEKAQKVRKSGLTFAPEAGTQRLRDVINKGVTAENLISSVKLAFEGGWTGVKLYFMLGLPTETLEDVVGINELARKVVYTYKQVPFEKRTKGLRVTVSASNFVPKPFTPFQWEPQDTIEGLIEKQKLLKEKLYDKSRTIVFNWHEAKVSFLEAVLARGDRKISSVIYKAWQKGCNYDSWDEFFSFEKWMEAFNECGIDPYFYANRKRDYEEVFPWDHIDFGISKDFLIKENKKAYEEKTTPNCMEGCSACGASVFGGGVCFE